MKIGRFFRLPAVRNIVLAILFFGSGFGLLILSPKNQPAEAQGGGDYSANWQATDLIVARLTRPDVRTKQNCESVNSVTLPYPHPDNSEAAIGPAKWVVTGQVDASSKFKEVWTTAAVPTRVTYGEGTWFPPFKTCNNMKLKFVGNQNQSEWLLGFANNKTLGKSAMDFRVIPVTQATTSINNFEPGRVANIGKTTSCQRTNRCVYTSGPYAWTVFHEFEEAGNGKHFNVGMLMPVRWDVTGFLCSAGDTRCD